MPAGRRKRRRRTATSLWAASYSNGPESMTGAMLADHRVLLRIGHGRRRRNVMPSRVDNVSRCALKLAALNRAAARAIQRRVCPPTQEVCDTDDEHLGSEAIARRTLHGQWRRLDLVITSSPAGVLVRGRDHQRQLPPRALAALQRLLPPSQVSSRAAGRHLSRATLDDIA